MPQRRIHKRYGMLSIAATIAIIVAFLLAANGTLARRQDASTRLQVQAHTDKVICDRVNKVYRTIQSQLQLSLRAIPTLTYYRTHPAELRAAQARTRAEIVAFRPQPCPHP